MTKYANISANNKSFLLSYVVEEWDVLITLGFQNLNSLYWFNNF